MKATTSIKSALVILSLCAPTSFAAVLAQYQFTSASLAASGVDPNLTAGPIDFTGSTASQNLPASLGFFADLLVIDAGAGAVDAATAVSTNSYYQYTITPGAGVTVDLSSMTFQGASLWSLPTGSGWAVRSSLDGFSSDLAGGAHTTPFPALASLSVDLSGPAFQGLTSAFTLRVYASEGIGNPSQVADRISLNGTATPIPEPSLPLLLLGGLGAVTLRRRRQ